MLLYSHVFLMISLFVFIVATAGLLLSHTNASNDPAETQAESMAEMYGPFGNVEYDGDGPTGGEPGSPENPLIGMIYPPRLGPLHNNFKAPGDPTKSCATPYAAIYKHGVAFNQCRTCR